jgi:hypothetical protein
MIKFVVGFGAGFVTANYIQKHHVDIKKVVDGWIAKLELQNDILKHDNPDIRG